MSWIYYAEYRTSGNPFGHPCALYRSSADSDHTESADERGEWVADDVFGRRQLTEPGSVIEQVSGDYARAVLATWRVGGAPTDTVER